MPLPRKSRDQKPLTRPRSAKCSKEYTSKVHGYNYNHWLCYPRRMADFNRNDMLFSSSDSPSPQRSFRGTGSVRAWRIAQIEVVPLPVVRNK
jgi:hypothetical protein